MGAFEQALILLLTVTFLTVAGRRLPWPLPISYVVGGAALAFWTAYPRIGLDPGFFFLGFLPPLLFSDAWLMPLREFMRAKRPIFLLAIGLVILTTLLVGWVAHKLIGLPLPLAFALGAIISPTDAVAATAIMEKLKVPDRLVAVIDGESLMNDATGLVAFKFALAAFMGGTFSLGAAAGEFLKLLVGGIAVGLAIGYAVGKLRDFLLRTGSAEPMIEITLSLLTPYAAYLGAEGLHLSGILAAVAAGFYSGWRDPVRMDAETRQTAWAVWSMVLFWLNGTAFVLLGLQIPVLVRGIAHTHPIGQLLGYVAAVSGVAIAVRLAWFFPGAYLPFLFSRKVRRTEQRPSWRLVLVGSWAGMRGAVTLAAALSLPFLMPNGTPLPFRDLTIFLALGVIVVTLFLQGTTTGALIHALGVKEDGRWEREDRLARIAAVDSGLKALRRMQDSVGSTEEGAALARVIGEYEERTAELVAHEETRDHAHARRVAERRFRLEALKAERHALDDLWRRNVIVDDVHRPLQQLLDHEESMLLASAE